MILANLPQAALSCDVIVGFPGETDEEFEESLALCRRVGFSRMHVFRYSKRPGTLAADMPKQVPPGGQGLSAAVACARRLGARGWPMPAVAWAPSSAPCLSTVTI